MPASPAQNASGAIPVFGAASFAMKSNRTGAIFNPWASIRFMMDFSRERQRRRAPSLRDFRGKKRASRARRFDGLLAPKRTSRKPLMAYDAVMRDVNLAECRVGDLAGAGAVFARGRYRSDDGDVSVARQMGGDFGKPSNILA